MAEFYVFDMDHTLIENDCDVSWKEFCVAEKLAPETDIAEADRFFQQYLAGTLDAEEFLAFQLREFVGKSEECMRELAREHFEKVVKNRIRPKALAYVRARLAAGKRCAILTSTNEIIARPIGEYFGIKEVYGAQLEIKNGLFTGKRCGVYTAGEGKAEIVRRLSAESDTPLADFAAYGDSINDLPLLKVVGEPYAVSPGASLKKEAIELGFTVLDWRE